MSGCRLYTALARNQGAGHSKCSVKDVPEAQRKPDNAYGPTAKANPPLCTSCDCRERPGAEAGNCKLPPPQKLTNFCFQLSCSGFEPNAKMIAIYFSPSQKLLKVKGHEYEIYK